MRTSPPQSGAVNTSFYGVRCPFGVLRRPFCLSCHLVCFRTWRYPATACLKSNKIKSLLLSHHRSTSALVSEILTSVLQTVQKKHKNNNNLHMDSTYLQTVQKTVQNTHTYTQYTQCTIKTYLVIDTHYTLYVHICIMYTSMHSNM